MRGVLLFLGGVGLVGCVLGRNFDAYTEGNAAASDASADAAPAPRCAADASFTADPANCESCGHDCLGGGCAGGVCQPVTLASGLRGLGNIVVDGDDVFFATDEAKRTGKVPKAGGAVVDLSTSNNTFVLAVNDTDLFFGGAGTNLRRTPRGGGAIDILADVDLGEVVAVPEAQFYCDYANARVGAGGFFRRTIDGKVTKILDGLSGCETIAVQGDWVYFGESKNTDGAQPKIRRAPRAGGPPTVLREGSARRIAVDGTHLYFVNYYASEIRRIPLAGGDDEVVADGPAEVRAGNVRVDGDLVYWTIEGSSGDGGGVYRVAKTGGAITTVASGDDPIGIALDARALYWAEKGSGKIVKLAR